MMVLHVRLYSNGSKQVDGSPKKQALCKLNHGSGAAPPVRLVSFHLHAQSLIMYIKYVFAVVILITCTSPSIKLNKIFR